MTIWVRFRYVIQLHAYRGLDRSRIFRAFFLPPRVSLSEDEGLCLLLFLENTSGSKDNKDDNEENDGNDDGNDENLLAVRGVVG